MTLVSFYAWFKQDYRPRARPDAEAHKQPLIFEGTKVSVCEQVSKQGSEWVRIYAPPGYEPEAGYPDLWIPLLFMSGNGLVPQPPPGEPGPVEGIPAEVAAAFVTIKEWLKS